MTAITFSHVGITVPDLDKAVDTLLAELRKN